MATTHLTWTTEREDKVCPECGGKTELVSASIFWDGDDGAEGHEIQDEVTGHYCPHCGCLRSLSLNTEE